MLDIVCHVRSYRKHQCLGGHALGRTWRAPGVLCACLGHVVVLTQHASSSSPCPPVPLGFAPPTCSTRPTRALSNRLEPRQLNRASSSSPCRSPATDINLASRSLQEHTQHLLGIS